MNDMAERKVTTWMESNAKWDIPGTQFVRTVLGQSERFMPHVVQDNSLSPDIREGDVVVIDTHKKLRGTGLFAVKGPFGVFLTRLQRKVEGGVVAITDYPEREVLELAGEPEVIGQVVLTLKKVS